MPLSKQEEELIYQLTEQLTGSCQQGAFRKDVIARNIERRIKLNNCENLSQYLVLVEKDQKEFDQMMSEITIHTTSWFREDPHFEIIQNELEKIVQKKSNIQIWSAACSTGEEVYSTALLVEQFRNKQMAEKQTFNYLIEGSDIDPKSVSKAKNAIYKVEEINNIPKQYHQYLLRGQNKANGLFTLDKNIRQRCRFDVRNLNSIDKSKDPYDIIICRNVLIYFDKKKQEEIIENLVSLLDTNGILILGHSDSFPVTNKITSLGNSTFKKVKSNTKPSINKTTDNKKSALIIDDSPVIRKTLGKMISKKFHTIDCESVEDADRILQKKQFDLITLDLNLPGENGASWLQKKRAQGFTTPVVIVSDSSPNDADKVFGALSTGAQDYIVKSRLHNEQKEILSLLETLSNNNLVQGQNNTVVDFQAKNFKPEIILIGASTGGPEALAKLVEKLPKNLPPIVVVQHISSEFAETFSRRLMNISGLKFKAIESTMPLERGHLYLSTKDRHLEIVEKNKSLHIKYNEAEKIEGHRPSVDYLFKSAAKTSTDCIAILLTGMGKDGVEGLGDLYRTGRSFTIAQDAKSSVVFGMPKKAIESGYVCFIGDIDKIRNEFLRRLNNEKIEAA